jgi:S-formylglutathione hydrolase FrmB
MIPTKCRVISCQLSNDRLDIMKVPFHLIGRAVLVGLAVLSAGALFGAPSAAQTAADVSTKPKRTSGAGRLEFEVTCAANLRNEPINGRVYVMLASAGSGTEPRLGPNWFRPQPFFAVDVKNWRPHDPLRVGSGSDGFPVPLEEIDPGKYAIQAVVRLNLDTHMIGDGEGNLYGPVVRAELDPKRGETVALEVDHVVEPHVFKSTERIKLVELASPRLSDFHKRPIKHRAAVILPTEIARREETTKLPTVYIIPGFGGDHFMAKAMADRPRMAYGNDFIRVVLDPDCGTGHHVFADSATNGPRGSALVDEFIPYIESKFPAQASPRARLLNGHSSGGWSSLWLQVTYPDFFGGTWSTSPDAVDFRDFQRIDLYASGENMFRDRDGKRRPIARIGDTPAIFYDRFCKMDDVIGWGGQLGSFEAVFSPLDQNGRPRKLWDRASGAIDPDVAKAWEAYDIRLVLERNWPVLGPKLKGKLHVIMGDMDNFYLEGAVKLLKESLAELGSDAVVEIIAGRDHGNLLDAPLAARINREMHAAVQTVLSTQPATRD